MAIFRTEDNPKMDYNAFRRQSDRSASAIASVAAFVLATTLTLSACVSPTGDIGHSNMTDQTSALSSDGYSADDAVFAQPYIDVDEMRQSPFPHRYVHGGFRETDTRFSFHFPMADAYEDRFFQYITPVPDSETLSQGLTGEEDRIGSALSSGAYFIETNGGGPNAANPMSGMDSTIGAYRANAASAMFSRHVAQQIYGTHRTYGYSYGGSGGAYRTIGGIENAPGVWDGAVPYVLGSPMAIPNVFTVRLQALRMLNEKLEIVADAFDAGGDGDPTKSMNEYELMAYREVTKMGFPSASWYAWRSMGPHGFAALYGGIRAVDPGYFSEFWDKKGYLGHDHPDMFANERIQFDTTISNVISADQAQEMGLEIGRNAGTVRGTADMAWKAIGLSGPGDYPVAFRLSQAPPEGWLMLSDLILPSGKKIVLSEVRGDIAIAGINDPRVLGEPAVGQQVRIDNSDILAIQSYHRHQIPAKGTYPVFDQFRDDNGNPLYPQRPMLVGPMFTANTSGSVPSGKFTGKMILIENAWDREAYPWQGDWYRNQVEHHLGGETDNNFRLWITDRALHGDHSNQDDPTRVVSYLGVLQQALRDLAAWAEQGKAPSPTSGYTVNDGQIALAPAAAERRGIQPVISLTANGKDRIEVARGTSVTMHGFIDAPPGTGNIISAQWDFDDDGIIDQPVTLADDTGAQIALKASFTFDKPGTYFTVLHGVSQRDGDRTTPFARIENLARLRVVVK